MGRSWAIRATTVFVFLLAAGITGCQLFQPDDDPSDYRPLPKAAADDINNVDTRTWSD